MTKALWVIDPSTQVAEGEGSRELADLWQGPIQVFHPALKPEEKRRAVYERLSDIVGGLSSDKLTGYPGFSLALMNDAGVREKVEAVLSDVIRDAQVE